PLLRPAAAVVVRVALDAVDRRLQHQLGVEDAAQRHARRHDDEERVQALSQGRLLGGGGHWSFVAAVWSRGGWDAGSAPSPGSSWGPTRSAMLYESSSRPR